MTNRTAAPTNLAAAGAISATSIKLGTGSILSNYTTWANYTPTVTLVGGAGNTVPQYTTNTGRWMQIGKTVFVRVYLTGDGGNEGAGTGAFTVALPVAVGASAPGALTQFAGLALNNATFYQLSVNPAVGATTVGLSYWSSLTNVVSFTGADQNNITRTVAFGLQYEVD